MIFTIEPNLFEAVYMWFLSDLKSKSPIPTTPL